MGNASLPVRNRINKNNATAASNKYMTLLTAPDNLEFRISNTIAQATKEPISSQAKNTNICCIE